MAERTVLDRVVGANLTSSNVAVDLYVTVSDASVTHTLDIKRDNTTILTFNLGSFPVGTQRQIVQFTATQRTTLLNAMPDVARFTATFVLTTFNNGTRVGDPSSAQADFSISGNAIKPVLGTFTYKDTNPSTVAMTGDDQFIVIGQSDITFYNVSATPYTGASIAYYRLSDNFSGNYIDVTSGGTVHYGTVDDVNLYDTGIETGFVVRAVDTRNQSSFRTVDVSGWSYYTPPFMQISGGVSRNAQDASHMDIHFKGAYSSVGGHNTVTATFKYRVTGTGAYSSEVSLPLTTSNGFECNATGLTGVNSAAFDESSVYDIVVTISDRLNSITLNYTLPAEVPMIAFRENAIGLGLVPSNTKSLELASDWIIRGAVENTTPTFTKTSGSSNIRSIGLFRFGAVCQLMMSLELHTASVGDIMLEGTLSGVPVPLGNGIGSAVHLGGVVLGGRYWNSGGTTPTLTIRLGALNYTQPSSTTYGTAFLSLIFLTAD